MGGRNSASLFLIFMLLSYGLDFTRLGAWCQPPLEVLLFLVKPPSYKQASDKHLICRYFALKNLEKQAEGWTSSLLSRLEVQAYALRAISIDYLFIYVATSGNVLRCNSTRQIIDWLSVLRRMWQHTFSFEVLWYTPEFYSKKMKCVDTCYSGKIFYFC